MRVLKGVLLAAAVLGVVIVAAVAYLAVTFDPRDYQPLLIDLVRERTGRTLAIDGDLQISFWPDLGLRAEGLSLSERDSTDVFATVESVRASLELAPLLERRLVANEIAVRGAEVTIVRFADGRLNIEDLLGTGDAAPVPIDIARLTVERSAIRYRDQASGATYDLLGLTAATGRLTDGLATTVSLASVLHGPQRAVEVAFDLHGELRFDRLERSYALERGSMALKGRAGRFDTLAARTAGSVRFDAGRARVDLGQTQASLGAQQGGETLRISLAARSAHWSGGAMRAAEFSAELAAQGALHATAALRTPLIEYADGVVRAGAVAGTLAMRRGEYRVSSRLNSPLRFDLRAQRLALPQLRAGIAAAGPPLGPSGSRAVVSGSAIVDLPREAVQLTLAGTFDDSRARLRLHSSGFAAPVHTLSAEIDRLDLARYAPAPATAGKPPADDPHLSQLTSLPASGTIRIGELIAGEVRARDVVLTLK